MDALCTFLTAVGLTLNGTCAPDVQKEMGLPDEDITVWQTTLPQKPKPIPPKPVVFPPVTVEKVIIKEVAAPVPTPVQVQEDPEPEPDPYRTWLEAKRQTQTSFVSTNAAWRSVDVSNIKKAKAGPDGLNAPASGSFAPPASVNVPQYDYQNVTSTEPVSNERVVTIDRYITGNIEGGINSQLASKEGGDVVIQVSRDVFGYGNRNKLIPKGSRLVCKFETAGSLNATRIPLLCFRILLAGDLKGRRVEITQLASKVGDQQGRGGATGEVNNHFEKQYGTAIMLSLISSAVRGSSAMLSSKDGKSSTTADIADAASQELGTRFGEISASVLEKTTNIEPTITIAQGYRVQIRPSKDWYLKEIKS